ncbi:MAG: helix-turn-helix domain-containing protein [Acidimicrobiales bacterium]
MARPPSNAATTEGLGEHGVSLAPPSLSHGGERGSPPSVGTRIREARVARQVGVRELARVADCSASLISQIERGRANPSVSTLYAISDALGISVASLFEPSVATRSDGSRPGNQGGSQRVSTGRDLRDSSGYSSDVQSSIVLRRADRRIIDLERGVRWELLLPFPERALEFLEVSYQPAGGSTVNEHAIRHHGRELSVIQEGTLSMQIGFEQYELGPGDSMAFQSTTPHRYWNAGSVPVRAIFVVIGR